MLHRPLSIYCGTGLHSVYHIATRHTESQVIVVGLVTGRCRWSIVLEADSVASFLNESSITCFISNWFQVMGLLATWLVRVKFTPLPPPPPHPSQLDHLTLMELNCIRPFLTEALDHLHLLHSHATNYAASQTD